MFKAIIKSEVGMSYELRIKKDLHTCKPNIYAVWKGDSWNTQRECLVRGLTKQQAIEFINKH